MDAADDDFSAATSSCRSMDALQAPQVDLEPGALAAAAGDEAAFTELAERYRRELQVHCYRLLGSFDEAEDLVQETLLRAWRRRSTFSGRSTFRAWLYAIATNACLDVLKRRPRASTHSGPVPVADVPWLQPYPDRLLEGIAPSEDEPDSALVAKETIELAFIAAIQLLPPRQRVVLIARDVLGWSARETAALLEISEAAANSALQRARKTLKKHLPRRRLEWTQGAEASAQERALLHRYVEATEHGDAAAMVALLREDAFFAMPPTPEWEVGNEAIVQAWVDGGFGSDSFGHLRCVLTRVNAQPAVAVYLRRPGEEEYRAFAIDVLRIEDEAIAEIIAFELDEKLLDALGVPRTL
jgi:RNA polymerase sigma-70 factor (ECF subfamily)